MDAFLPRPYPLLPPSPFYRSIHYKFSFLRNLFPPKNCFFDPTFYLFVPWILFLGSVTIYLVYKTCFHERDLEPSLFKISRQRKTIDSRLSSPHPCYGYSLRNIPLKYLTNGKGGIRNSCGKIPFLELVLEARRGDRITDRVEFENSNEKSPSSSLQITISKDPLPDFSTFSGHFPLENFPSPLSSFFKFSFGLK